MKNLFTTIFATAALLVANNAWAEEATLIYGRDLVANEIEGVSAWSADNISSDWNGNATYNADHGLYINGSGNRTTSHTFSIEKNSLLNLQIVWFVGGNTGSASNESYIQIGDNIKISANEQNQVGLVNINGIESSITNACGKSNNNRTDDIWTINVTINTASNSLDNLTITGTNGNVPASYTLAGGVTLQNSIATTLTVTMATNRAAGTPYTGLHSILLYQTAQSVATADYAINYLYDSSIIKTTSGNVAIGSTINAESPITIDDTKYYAIDGATTSMEIVDGDNTLNVELREALTTTAKVLAKDGEGNTLKEFSEIRTEGDPATNIYYTRGVKYNDKYYFVPGSFINGVNYGVNMSYGSEDVELTYTLDESVVYYAEENELSVSRSFAAQGGTAERASGGDWQRLYKSSYAYTAALSKGVYSIEVAGRNQGSKTAELAIEIRDSEGNITDSYNETLSWASSTYSAQIATNINVPEGGSIVIANNDETYNSNLGLDYVIVRTISTTYTIKYVNTDNEEIQTAVVDNIYVGETFTASDDQMANIIYQESDYGYLSGNEEKTAVADAEQNVITLVYKKATVTAIDGVKANAEAGAIYTLGGVKVNNPTQGLYIQDGKLISVK